MPDTFVYGDGELASDAVIERVAAAKAVRPEEMEPPLYDAIDPDALDRLLHDGRGTDITIRFAYQGLEITVDSDATINIESLETESNEDARIEGSGPSRGGE